MNKAEALHIYHQLKSRIGSKAKNGFYVFKIVIAKDIMDAFEVINNPLLSAIAHNPVKFYNETDDLDVFVFFADGNGSICQHYLMYVQDNDIDVTYL